MNSTLHRFATPLITGLFLISLISGVALFLHLGSGYFKNMHEWLSMVLILPFILHIWKNWRAMTVYFKKPAFVLSMFASLVAAAVFAYQASGNSGRAGGPPQFAFAHAILDNSVEKVAPLLGYTAESLVAQLKSAGFEAAAEQTLNDVASKSGKNEFQLIEAIPIKSQ
jgi:glucan phosphoethanolaminetransferase (alkaline phosphatase superfamily)